MAKIKMCETGKELRKYIYTHYEKVKGRPYNASFSKDGYLCNLLGKRFPLSWLKGMYDFFIKWDDEFVKNTGYTIGVFYSQINKMLELNIHRSDWTKKHEQSKMSSAGEVIETIMKKVGKK